MMGERKGGEKPGPKIIQDCFGGNVDIGPGPKGRFGNLSWTRKFDQNTHINLGDSFVDHVAGRYGSLTSFDGKVSLELQHNYGYYYDLVERGKFTEYFPIDKSKNNYAESPYTTNCYGYTLTNGYFAVNATPKEVINFLDHTGYNIKEINDKTTYDVGDILVWNIQLQMYSNKTKKMETLEEGGHIIEAVGKNKKGEVLWESFWNGEVLKTTLPKILKNNDKYGVEYSKTRNAILLSPDNRKNIKFNEKKYKAK